MFPIRRSSEIPGLSLTIDGQPTAKDYISFGKCPSGHFSSEMLRIYRVGCVEPLEALTHRRLTRIVQIDGRMGLETARPVCRRESA